MTEGEKRFKIEKVKSYVAEKKDYNKKEAKAFGVGALALGVLIVGVKSFLELINVAPTGVDITYTNSIVVSLSGISTAIELKSIATIINAIKNKIYLSGRIEEINEELDLLGDQENNKFRGGR